MIFGIMGNSLRSYCSHAVRSGATKPLLQQACISRCFSTPSFAALRPSRLNHKSVTDSLLWRLYCTSNTPVGPADKKTDVTTPKARKPLPSYKEFTRPPHSRMPKDGEKYITEDMLVESINKNQPVMTFEEKVKANAKTSWYTLIMFVGISFLLACATMLYQDMFSSNSVNYIYGEVAKIVKKNPQVQDMLGNPMIAHGEQTSRGWRRHVMHTQFYNDGVLYFRMRFYLKGGYRDGTVNVEKKANSKGNFKEYTYIIVEADGYPPRSVDIDVDNL